MNGNDNINLEYEARVMITENQYSQIVKSYADVKHKEFTNTNHYFDYVNLYLTDNGMVLRVRNINDKKYELTLKIKGENGDKEINHPLTSKETQYILETNIIPDCNVKDELCKRNIDLSKLAQVANLKTERIEICYSEYLLVIDKNYYRNKVDFNIEVESTSKKLAKIYLNQIISLFKIENKKDYISKSRRAIYNL